MKRVLIDVDGVVADFVGAGLRTLVQIGGPVVERDTISTWQMRDCLPPEWADALFATWKHPGWCASIPVFDGAQEAVAAIHRKAEVIFVTAALPDAPHWMWERTCWLGTHFNVTDRNIIFTWAKHVVTGDMLVDDKTANIIEWHQEYPEGIAVLWETPANRNDRVPEKVIRTRNWAKVLELLGE